MDSCARRRAASAAEMGVLVMSGPADVVCNRHWRRLPHRLLWPQASLTLSCRDRSCALSCLPAYAETRCQLRRGSVMQD